MSRKRFPPEMQLSIESLAEDGVGLASFGEKSVRVKAGLPGEELVARTVGRRKGAALAVAEAVTAARSPQRIEPACEFYPRCGGCALQHMSYSNQLAHKVWISRPFERPLRPLSMAIDARHVLAFGNCMKCSWWAFAKPLVAAL